MLGQAGYDALVIDTNAVYPSDFRCEKLDGSQVRVLRKTGLADAVLQAATSFDRLWIARFGRFLQKRGNDQFGIYYDALVNAIRGQIVPCTDFILGKVSSIQTGADKQTLKLSDGGEIQARLIVLATGPNNALRHSLGIERHDLSPCHSVSIGFDLKPVGRRQFEFPALTYYPERPADRIAYLTMFPIGALMRANLFVYQDARDPWLRKFREAPHATLYEAMPGLRKLMPDFELVGEVKVRPVDLYVTTGHRQAGVVLVGDAFATSCPAAGTGANKVFTDVERLCNVYIPQWLATPGMGVEKICAFYDDPIKTASDAESAEKAFRLKAVSIDSGVWWRLRRSAKFAVRLGLSVLRHQPMSAQAMSNPASQEQGRST